MLQSCQSGVVNHSVINRLRLKSLRENNTKKTEMSTAAPVTLNHIPFYYIILIYNTLIVMLKMVGLSVEGDVRTARPKKT